MYWDYFLMYFLYDCIDKGIYFVDGYIIMSNFVCNIIEGLFKEDWGMYINYFDFRGFMD